MISARFYFQQFLGRAKKFAARLAELPAFFAGRRILDRDATCGVLSRFGCRVLNGKLHEIACTNACTSIEILSSGVVRMNGSACLDFDYGSRGALAGWTGAQRREPFVAALWSHSWMGYYHWIVDVLPKIALLREQYPKNDDLPYFVFPRTGEPFEEEALSMLGIPPEKVIDSRDYKSIFTERLAFSLLPGWFQIHPATQLLRKQLISNANDGLGKKIYLTRAGRRRCLNENDVCHFLTNRGFVVVSDTYRSVADQIGIFHQAEVIVALHGAALTNLLWCKPGTKIIECFSDHYQPPYYRNLSSACALDYHSTPLIPNGLEHWSSVSEDITINLSELEYLLEDRSAHTN
jgi:hypothetical protein